MGCRDCDDGGLSSSHRGDDRGQGDPGHPYGFTRHALPSAQGRGHSDPDYQQWREEQVGPLDDDYDTWRKERYQKFSDDFSQSRPCRPAAAAPQQGPHHCKGTGSSTAASGPAPGAHSGASISKDAT